jgi:nicotinamide riboside transporter PnuC
MIDLVVIIGIIGMLFLLSAFALNLFTKVTENWLIYNVLNIIGAGLLAYYAYILKSFPFLILESIWILFAVYKLITRKKGIVI